MTPIPPVATPATPQADATTLNASPTADLTPEQQAFEYAMEVQQGGVVDGGRLANPAALVSEMLNSLRDFVKRAHRMSKIVEQVEGQTHSKIRTADASTGGLYGPMQYDGPAQSSLGSIGSDFGRTASDEVGNEFDLRMEISRNLLDASLYGIQAKLIGKAVAEISKSAKTLMSGQ
jgi:hypothetical protein